MFGWQQKCSSRTSIHFNSNPTDRANNEIEQQLAVEKLQGEGSYMFSEVTYLDELFDIGTPTFGLKRGQPSLFFKIVRFDGAVRYRSAASDEALLTKYKDITTSTYITQEEYAKLRAHSVRINQDDLE